MPANSTFTCDTSGNDTNCFRKRCIIVARLSVISLSNTCASEAADYSVHLSVSVIDQNLVPQ